MGNSKYSLFLAACCLLGCQLLAADPVPTFVATSASAVTGVPACSPNFGCDVNLSAVGNSFTLSGTGFGAPGVTGPFGIGAPGYSTSFTIEEPSISPISTVASGQVTLSGTTESVQYVGSASVTAAPFILNCTSPPGCMGTVTVSSGTITAPPITLSSPSTTIFLPATMQGSFAACVPPLPPATCTSSSPAVADVSINLSGELAVTIDVGYTGAFPNTVSYTESFVSTPEPTSILLLALGMAVAIAVISRRKYRQPQ